MEVILEGVAKCFKECEKELTRVKHLAPPIPPAAHVHMSSEDGLGQDESEKMGKFNLRPFVSWC